MTFHDHFSQRSEEYAARRPRYPAALYAWLAGQAPGRELALDLATGNGQAAVGLADHFAVVVASDASAAQVERAFVHPKVRYAVAPADASGLPPQCADLVTIAQALHWLDPQTLWPEVARVLRPDGVIAVWCYDLVRVDAAVDGLLDRHYHQTVGPYWPPERKILETGYRTVPFPFAEIVGIPNFAMELTWTAADLLAYLGTWSATERYRASRGEDPTALLAPELLALWPREEPRAARFPLALRVGRPER